MQGLNDGIYCGFCESYEDGVNRKLQDKFPNEYDRYGEDVNEKEMIYHCTDCGQYFCNECADYCEKCGGVICPNCSEKDLCDACLKSTE